MKERVFLFACVSLLGLILIPAQLFADGLCQGPIEYSQCGTPLSPVTFTITQVSFPWAIIQADWYGHYADFKDYIYVYDITTGFSSPLSSWSNQDGQQRGAPDVLVNDISKKQFRLGDQVEFVIRVTNDPNHPGGIDYCQDKITCVKDTYHNQPLGHVFAENL